MYDHCLEFDDACSDLMVVDHQSSANSVGILQLPVS